MKFRDFWYIRASWQLSESIKNNCSRFLCSGGQRGTQGPTENLPLLPGIIKSSYLGCAKSAFSRFPCYSIGRAEESSILILTIPGF